MKRDAALDEERGPVGGKFTDITDTLLPLFSDPDGRSGRCWEDIFGVNRTPAAKPGGIRFTVRVRRRSSSGS